jgi:hypothetical protein
LIFCHVHFFRGIQHTIGQKEKTDLFQNMAAILDCQSRDDYYQLIDHFMSKSLFILTSNSPLGAAEAGNGLAQPGNAAPDRPTPRRYKSVGRPPS